jgi:hypothetical protein
MQYINIPGKYKVLFVYIAGNYAFMQYINIPGKYKRLLAQAM